MRNTSNSYPLLVIKAYKLLILLSCRGIIVRDSAFLLLEKKDQSMCCSSNAGTRSPDLFEFLHHLFTPTSHLLLGFTCSMKTLLSVANRFLWIFIRNGSGFTFLHSGPFNHKPCVTRRQVVKDNRVHLPFCASGSVIGELADRGGCDDESSSQTVKLFVSYFLNSCANHILWK